MGLFEVLRVSSDCYLCGCPIPPTAGHSSNVAVNAPILCDYCHQHLPQSHHTCISCGLPLTIASSYNSESPHTASPHTVFPHIKSAHSVQAAKENIPCGECLKQSLPYDRTLSGFHYEPPINDFITQLKYSAQFQLLPLLCDYLIDKIKQNYTNEPLPDGIIAVPLHPKKLAQRGFNQSHLIAKRMAQALNIKLISKGIQRIKHTQAQSGLNSMQRKTNVKNAFSVKVQLPQHIAIVDDVVTTGMTVAELAKQARLQGTSQIDVWCLARAYDL